MSNASSPSLLPHPMKETKKAAERFELELSQSIACSLKHHMLIVASYIGLKRGGGGGGAIPKTNEIVTHICSCITFFPFLLCK